MLEREEDVLLVEALHVVVRLVERAAEHDLVSDLGLVLGRDGDRRRLALVLGLAAAAPLEVQALLLQLGRHVGDAQQRHHHRGADLVVATASALAREVVVVVVVAIVVVVVDIVGRVGIVVATAATLCAIGTGERDIVDAGAAR